MTPEAAKQLPKYTPNPLTASLPDFLKDHANYDRIRKEIYNAGATKHSHSDVGEWAACAYCMQREWNRKEFMKRLGFKSEAQYKEWQKTHARIDELQKIAGFKK